MLASKQARVRLATFEITVWSSGNIFCLNKTKSQPPVKRSPTVHTRYHSQKGGKPIPSSSATQFSLVFSRVFLQVLRPNRINQVSRLCPQWSDLLHLWSITETGEQGTSVHRIAVWSRQSGVWWPSPPQLPLCLSAFPWVETNTASKQREEETLK
jgi:hypothetical protein